MKKIQFLITILVLAAIPAIFTSCKPTPEPKEATIIGSWIIKTATRQNNEGSSQGWPGVEGQVWTFDESSKVRIDNQEYDYTLSEKKLYTSYAAKYDTTYFSVKELTVEDMILFVVEEPEQYKVGSGLKIIYTFYFDKKKQ
jgi:hypothetical protein